MRFRSLLTMVFLCLIGTLIPIQAKNVDDYNITIIYPEGLTTSNRYQQQVDLVYHDNTKETFDIVFENSKDKKIIVGVRSLDLLPGVNGFYHYENANGCGLGVKSENNVIEAFGTTSIPIQVDMSTLSKETDSTCAIGLVIMDYSTFSKENINLKNEPISEYINIVVHQTVQKEPMDLQLNNFVYINGAFEFDLTNPSGNYYDLLNINAHILNEKTQEIVATLDILEGRVFPNESTKLKLPTTDNIEATNYKLLVEVNGNDTINTLESSTLVSNTSIKPIRTYTTKDYIMIGIGILIIILSLLHILRVLKHKKQMERRKEFRKVNYID